MLRIFSAPDGIEWLASLSTVGPILPMFPNVRADNLDRHGKYAGMGVWIYLLSAWDDPKTGEESEQSLVIGFVEL